MSRVVLASRHSEHVDEHFDTGTTVMTAVSQSRQAQQFQAAVATPTADRPTRRTSGGETELKGFAMKRRLKGFVVEASGDTWRVMFVEDGRKIPYDLPSKQLTKAGISSPGQPFEMDELESMLPDISGKVYRFRPMAAAEESFSDILNLSPERREKRDFILAKLGKPKA